MGGCCSTGKSIQSPTSPEKELSEQMQYQSPLIIDGPMMANRNPLDTDDGIDPSLMAPMDDDDAGMRPELSMEDTTSSSLPPSLAHNPTSSTASIGAGGGGVGAGGMMSPSRGQIGSPTKPDAGISAGGNPKTPSPHHERPLQRKQSVGSTASLGQITPHSTKMNDEKNISDFPEHLQPTAKLAFSGNPEAQFSLGFAFDTGNEGVPANTDEAIRWYTLSAQQSHAPAQNNLGVLFATGHRGKMEKNHRMALRWYKHAAENGNAAGQFHAALLIMNGQGVNKPNPEYAMSLLQRAAKQSHVMARAMLGTVLFEGKICAKDEKKGLKYLQKAATAEDPVALHNLAVVYKRGLGVEAQPERADAYFGLAKQSKTAKLFEELRGDRDTVGETFIRY
eukprot:TRINITY_DN2010_c0_g1_i1.p1 TRINITY_DN2010_c0_g1~~TRINITY_DN2010_c0_g1_i1.p1  ORF type:complete len:393 (-),score=92.74 TRINITY_DN2010_c0_g1_i1:66-1244(-)